MSQKEVQNVVVLGAGAWGTALAIHLSRSGQSVSLWAHSEVHTQSLMQERKNQKYLPQVHFPDSLRVVSDLASSLESADAILVVVPSHVFRQALSQVSDMVDVSKKHIAWATKGFEPESKKLLHEIARQELCKDCHYTVLSGPTFAAEVAKGLPTAMVSASTDEQEAAYWASLFHHDAFRMYTQGDIAGVEVGGAYKNIMAIATGVSDGLHLGANARAAIISRGMAEMMRFAGLYGATPETLMGLAGLGDLVLTCTDNLSRNRQFGLKLASPKQTSESAQQEIGQVVEGVKAVRVVKAIADEKGLDLPIAEQVYQLVEGNITAKEAAEHLLARELKAES
ncbi:NAD(P)H-dependent glycerol-3-phosphate dehydrogenase [Hydrogenovibrio sp. JE_KL2]|uniref:NAD(P)H-dependent glycerol-3-phosphate dehydrogenase n=1 Tax=Hydrogenovibrio sp. JE_KL2 TaxID=2651188 RepID=UPI00128D8352|nr:NAD(P)H-dependent glycerol-3-phosphate dehydrogenase [Hydrogenovibrio sp. JE_KL2]MPQ76270.1 NAD(P)-dependent glycerol-3-phosphate dehydrogenase [Hydrogenovibrio sp. JE_KL2]